MIDKISQNLRLLIASVISIAIISLWQYLYVGPMMEGYEENKPQQHKSVIETERSNEEKEHDRTDLIARGLADKTRVKIENADISGSINLLGARIDDLVLKNYKTSITNDSGNVSLLSPSKTNGVYFSEFGWVGNNIELPDSKILWNADKHILNAGQVVTLSWINGKGIKFIIKIALDENYMFSVNYEVKNNSNDHIRLSHYALINRLYEKGEDRVSILHEGPIGVFSDKLEEIDYEDVLEKGKLDIGGSTGWVGFTDKYWLSAIIPGGDINYSTSFSYAPRNKHHRYQNNVVSNNYGINPRESKNFNIKFFAGAKEIDLLDKYESRYGIKLFDRAVDFGVLYFITKPIFTLLHYFYNYIGNFGLAILLLTILIKLLLFPLAHKGFKGMNRLKDLQPKMTALKEKYEDSPQAFQKALIELYKKEKVNPMAGCLPIILQIPIFFALYKVLYVTIEMRHAPFFWWINDLSAPDPTTIFNLFGLFPWSVPAFLMIGVFPIVMAFTMFVQQKLNPEPTDPVQAKVMKFLPLIFLFMFSSFPSGLVIYWSWSNFLSILQQLLIKKLESSELKKKS
jgi:YidC/Oxa1 family membrane protein insertase